MHACLSSRTFDSSSDESKSFFFLKVAAEQKERKKGDSTRRGAKEAGAHVKDCLDDCVAFAPDTRRKLGLGCRTVFRWTENSGKEPPMSEQTALKSLVFVGSPEKGRHVRLEIGAIPQYV